MIKGKKEGQDMPANRGTVTRHYAPALVTLQFA